MSNKLTKDNRITEITEGPYAGLYGPGFQVGVTKPGHCGHGYKIGECPFCWPVEPTVIEGDGTLSDSVEAHPAYAMIGAYRVAGAGRLFGSDFLHQHFMIVRIKRAELHRGLSSDRVHGREEYVEVEMSEAQWATFISTPNSGDGVPCTLSRKDGNQISRLPAPKSRAKQFGKEMRDRLDHALDELKSLREHIAAGKGGKKALDLLSSVERQLLNNTEFVADQFDEHMEQTVEKAKIEVSTYIQTQVNKAGLEALKGKALLALGEKSDV